MKFKPGRFPRLRFLARMLLILANFGKEGKPERVIAKVSQEMLAEHGRHDAIAGELLHE